MDEQMKIVAEWLKTLAMMRSGVEQLGRMAGQNVAKSKLGGDSAAAIAQAMRKVMVEFGAKLGEVPSLLPALNEFTQAIEILARGFGGMAQEWMMTTQAWAKLYDDWGVLLEKAGVAQPGSPSAPAAPAVVTP